MDDWMGYPYSRKPPFEEFEAGTGGEHAQNIDG